MRRLLIKNTVAEASSPDWTRHRRRHNQDTYTKTYHERSLKAEDDFLKVR